MFFHIPSLYDMYVYIWFLIIHGGFLWTPQLVFCTVGFSGADIRNLVNEAAIMSVSGKS